ncbi:hypothetical protein DXT94_29995 [Rhizobium sp. ICMP 5592]|nr:hypothetical protein [Rhizobium sp. ICMP 5592]
MAVARHQTCRHHEGCSRLHGTRQGFDAGILAPLKMNDLLTKVEVASSSEDAVRDARTRGAKIAAITVPRAVGNPLWSYEIG